MVSTWEWPGKALEGWRQSWPIASGEQEQPAPGLGAQPGQW